MLRIGLTGGIGSGKSTVARLLAARGAAVVDADEIARQVVVPGGPAYAPILDRFGQGVLASDGTIDRPALAAVAFGDPRALADLNAITHPLIGLEMARQLAELEGDEGTTAVGRIAPAKSAAPDDPRIAADTTAGGAADTTAGDGREGDLWAAGVAVVVIPLLRQHHVEALRLGAVVVVDCPVEVAVDRLVQRRGMNESDARARIEAQIGRAERLALADYVVDNSGSAAQLAQKVDALWAWMERRSAPAG